MIDSFVTNSRRVVVAQNNPNSFFFGASSFPPFPPFPLVVFVLLDVVPAATPPPGIVRPARDGLALEIVL